MMPDLNATLVGKEIMFNFNDDGWFRGVVDEVKTDPNETNEGPVANFIVYYEADDQYQGPGALPHPARILDAPGIMVQGEGRLRGGQPAHSGCRRAAAHRAGVQNRRDGRRGRWGAAGAFRARFMSLVLVGRIARGLSGHRNFCPSALGGRYVRRKPLDPV
jgi:hypothetical protein